ncbi:MAG TPA: hypothetical protein VHZ29_16895 [Rhizomicrobium sp.]|jgi:hypothetical protein|nr:hypothetical protein [Rhizomicrobium sp.]
MDGTMTEDRNERVSASLEAQFNSCRNEADAYLSTAKTTSGELTEYRIDNFLKLVRMNAQLAGIIARLDDGKNRNSKTK